jgi:DNA-binding IclR family transcriptional regulator
MAVALESKKTKIAKRVIEVLEYFASGRDEATVMDVARTYGRPQSSTSELLSSLVEMGLLSKNPHKRCYSPTARLAALGFAGQPEMIRSGRLFGTMDRLAQSSRLSVVLIGLVGTHAQVFRVTPGCDAPVGRLGNGHAVRLSESAAGLLLLATQGHAVAERILWRLNSEVDPSARFDRQAMMNQLMQYGQDSHATGASGFVPGMQITAILTDAVQQRAPLALGFLYRDDACVDPHALAVTLRRGMGQVMLPDGEREGSFLRSLGNA